MLRWEVIDQLVTTPIPWSLPAEVDDIMQLCDDWAEVLVQAAAFAHVRARPAAAATPPGARAAPPGARTARGANAAGACRRG
jgi:hypothetical protein